jgi:nucleotide-binding universal stress UspA family protein
VTGAAERPVLAGVDGSESALEAVRWAAREADRRKAGLRLVTAFGWMPVRDEDDPLQLVPPARDELRAAAEQHLATAAAAGPVVVGSDGSPASEAALAFAVEEAVALAAPLVAVHAWQDVAVGEARGWLLYTDSVAKEARTRRENALAPWRAKHPELTIEPVVVRDRAAEALVHRSAEAQLVVVGSRGRGALAGLLLGSVGQAVLRHAACPVAVVH